MDLKKGIGEFFRPRNMFSRGARIGGTALGASVGQPQLGYQAGDFVADKWIDKDSAKDQGAMEGFIMRGEDPTGGALAGGFAGASTGAIPISSTGSSESIDPKTAMKMMNLFNKNNPSQKTKQDDAMQLIQLANMFRVQ